MSGRAQAVEQPGHVVLPRRSGRRCLHMALPSLTVLDRYKVTPFPPGYPEAARTFYSPVDDLHGALTDLVRSTTKSLVIAMYGYDDDHLNQIIQEQLSSE